MDYEKIFSDIGNNEVLNIIKNVSLSQSKIDIPEDYINEEIISFLVSQIKIEETQTTYDTQKRISNDIDKLKEIKNWVSLYNISKYVMEKCLETIKKDEFINDHIINTMGIEVKNFVLNASVTKLKGVFNEEWLKENYKDVYDFMMECKNVE